VVIIGQDPYFGPRQAHGAFRLILEVPSFPSPPLPSPLLLLPREGGGLGAILSVAEFSYSV